MSERTLFQPVGKQARWKPIYEALKELEPGELLSYEDMGEMVGLDFIDHRPVLHSAARRAVKELEKNDGRTCRIERGHGYRIATPEQQVALAIRHQDLAHRHIRRAHDKVTIVDLNQVDPETAKHLAAMAHSLAEQDRFIRAVHVRQERLEDALRMVAHGVDARMRTHEQRTAEELADVRAQLAELTQKVHDAAAAPASTPASAPAPSASAGADSAPVTGFGPLFAAPGPRLR